MNGWVGGSQLGWELDALVFGLSILWLGVIWVGYPLLVGVCARCRRYRPRATALGASEQHWPTVSVIVCAHNEAGHIVDRIHNLWQQRYPAARLEIIVSEDGSSDETASLVRERALAGRFRVRLLSASKRTGKAAAINRAVAAARGDIVVLTDANNAFLPETVRHLVAPFADGEVGAVVGRKTVNPTSGVGGGESVYWRYEAWLATHEMRAGSAVSAYGEALALRRATLTPLPTDRPVSDDLYPVLRVLARRQRVIAAAGAVSYENAAPSDTAEWERRQRMAAARWGALAALGRGWTRMGWWRTIQVLFHQVLRPLSAVWLLTSGLSGATVLLAPPGAVVPCLVPLAWLQTLGWLAIAGVGVARAMGARLGRLEAPYFFVLALLASLGGWWRYLRGRQSVTWQRVARTTCAGARQRASEATTSAHAPSSRAMLNSPGVNSGRILNGLFWASSSFVAGKLLVFGSVVVLARLLAPRAFGAVTLASSTILVLEVFGTLGLTSALIYEETSVTAAASVCFWTLMATSVLEVGVGWWLAPRLSTFFHEPALAPMLRLLLVGLVLTTSGNTHDTLLRRGLEFRHKIVPDLGMAAAKGAVSIALARLGWGAWSLIWGQVIGSGISTVLLWWVTPWRPEWSWDAEVVRRMLAYAKHIYLLDTSSVLLINLDSLTIGRMLSDAWLGFYTIAFRIPEVLLISVLNVITRVVFPAFSRLQTDRTALRATLLTTVGYTALLTLPMAAGMGLLARPMILGLYGWRWGPSIPVLQILAVYAGLRCLTHHFGDGYKAIGRPDVLTKTTLAWWILLPPSLILGAHWGGIVGVAWGQIATRAFILVLHLYLISRYLEIRPLALWRQLAPAIESTGVMGVGLFLMESWLHFRSPRLELVTLIPLGVCLYGLTLGVRHRELSAELLGHARGWMQRRPPRPAELESEATGMAAPLAVPMEPRS